MQTNPLRTIFKSITVAAALGSALLLTAQPALAAVGAATMFYKTTITGATSVSILNQDPFGGLPAYIHAVRNANALPSSAIVTVSLTNTSTNIRTASCRLRAIATGQSHIASVTLPGANTIDGVVVSGAAELTLQILVTQTAQAQDIDVTCFAYGSNVKQASAILIVSDMNSVGFGQQ